jgi:hypothetical protein
MSSLSYLVPRLIRHFLPESVVRFLLLHGWIIRPGMETSNPSGAVERYQQVLHEHGVEISGKRILVLGYGGRFEIGCTLIGAGASHVVLCEYKVKPDQAFNLTLLKKYTDLLKLINDKVEVNPEKLTLVEGDIRQVAIEHILQPVDIVLSNSVFEHLVDVPGITRALAVLSAKEAVCLHFVDLRDHFFKYPFEMLRFSSRKWYGWLNPTSHHNRLRIWNYRTAFVPVYNEVEIKVLGTDVPAFQKVAASIQPEFKRGSLEENAVTHISIFARDPKQG